MMEQNHQIMEVKTPVSVIARCSCGWSATQTRRQNAWARNAKLQKAKRAHLDRVNEIAEAKFFDRCAAEAKAEEDGQ